MTQFTHVCARCSECPVDYENEYCSPCTQALINLCFGTPLEEFVAILGTVECRRTRQALKVIYYHKLYGSNKNIKQILGED